jgi:pimeloyl-ACP methyl ester carboxylesterase
MQIDRDGVKLFFQEAGSGTPPLLLVHGWTCDHTYLAPQLEYFRDAHRVVAVDLRGHGQSDKPQQDYTMAGFADDLVWLCGRLKIEKPVVIGHSMGGVITLALAARAPQLPSAIVTVDSPILPLPAVASNVRLLLDALRGPGYRQAQRDFVSNMLFIATDDPARKQKILDQMSSAPQHVMASAFENIFTFDHEAAAAACKVPWLMLYPGHVTTDLARLHTLCPHVTTGQTVGAGHFQQLEVPEQVNAMIARFLATTAS